MNTTLLPDCIMFSSPTTLLLNNYVCRSHCWMVYLQSQSTYSVAEEGVELRVCANITGLSELYTTVSFTTAISGNNSGQNCS